MVVDKTGNSFQRTPLDPGLLVLQEDELTFFKLQTGIQDSEELREHILKVQAEAYEKFPYPCIRRFLFTNLKVSRAPEYDHVLQLGQSRGDAILLDIGCCFGNDIRKFVADGYPIQNVIGLDVRREFWELGHKLFNSTPSTFPIKFIEGSIFDDSVFHLSLPSYSFPHLPAPPLPKLGNSLNFLRHHVSVIYVSAVFHLFSEDQQLQLGRKLGALLSPLPGSMILGSHIGMATAGIKTETLGGIKEMFCHSPESWRDLWDGVVFEKGTVEVRAVLLDALEMPSKATAQPFEKQGPDTSDRWRNTSWLRWSVMRI